MFSRETVHALPGFASTHPLFKGHFPGNPVVPGSVIVAEVLLCLSRQHVGSPPGYELATIKFPTPLRPDTPVLVRFRYERNGQISFTAQSDVATVAIGRLRADPTDATRTTP